MNCGECGCNVFMTTMLGCECCNCGKSHPQKREAWVKPIDWGDPSKKNKHREANGKATFHDIIFQDNASGIMFCDFEKGAICLNSRVSPQHQGVQFFVDYIHECIGHETLHLVINELEGECASHLMHNIDCFGDLRDLPYSWFA